jgi:DNA ligase (NAD+)
MPIHHHSEWVVLLQNFQTVAHDHRMYSLDKFLFEGRFNRLGKPHSKVLGAVPLEYTCELKYDGASISITYENGKRAVTRGDGFQGMM